MQRLNKGAQKTTPFELLKASTAIVLGVPKKSFTGDGLTRLCNFSTYGGTEREVNGLLVVDDTATVITWYDPEIKSGDRIKLLESGAVYDIIGQPENIELRNQEMSFKVSRIKGGA